MKKLHSDSGVLSSSQQWQLRRKLLAWYDRHARELPWRASRDPYRVWLSEIMLQQTRVAAVIEHYREFLRRFPTVEKLAAAREASVLAVWSGLGYYRRARMLHAAAKVVVGQRGGRFPQSDEGLRSLPGIGRYTAAAIASIAFGQLAAVVDGNVERVLQRIVGRRMAGEAMWETANYLLDAKRPGDFNQAMMELGAIVCTPRAPKCLTCPVVGLCATRGELPATAAPVRQKKREIHYALYGRNEDGRNEDGHNENCRDGNRRGAEILLVRRPQDQSLMPGMWELPEASGRNGFTSPAFTLRHSITVTDYRVKVWRMAVAAEANGQWIPTKRLSRFALTGLARKILRTAEML